MLLADKRILVTGVLNDASMAFHVARRAQEEGAEVVLTSFGRAMSLTQRAARRLPTEPTIVELDVTDAAHLDALAAQVGGHLDGVLHAIGFAPESCLGGGFLDRAVGGRRGRAAGRARTRLKALAVACRPLMASGGSIVGLDFDNSRVAWPVYDWMGVAKAAFESTARYLARDLGAEGIRVNLVAAGPIRTIAARSIPASSSSRTRGTSGRRSAGTSTTPRPSRAACVALLSDLFPATTGEVDPRRRRLPRHRRLTRTVPRHGPLRHRVVGRSRRQRQAELVGDRDRDEPLLERRAGRLRRVEHEPPELAAAAHHRDLDAAGRQQEIAPRDEPRAFQRAAVPEARELGAGTLGLVDALVETEQPDELGPRRHHDVVDVGAARRQLGDAQQPIELGARLARRDAAPPRRGYRPRPRPSRR